MDIYVLNFTTTTNLIQKSHIVLCQNSIDVAIIINRAENTGYNLSYVDKLSNVYDINGFLQLLELSTKDDGTDLLFGNKK